LVTGLLYFTSDAPNRSGAGAKSAEQYDKHVQDQAEAEERLSGLEEKLSNAKGPKAQRPIQKEIEKVKEAIKGHEKEIRQKWPSGRPIQ